MNPCRFSRPVHSTALPPLRIRGAILAKNLKQTNKWIIIARHLFERTSDMSTQETRSIASVLLLFTAFINLLVILGAISGRLLLGWAPGTAFYTFFYAAQFGLILALLSVLQLGLAALRKNRRLLKRTGTQRNAKNRRGTQRKLKYENSVYLCASSAYLCVPNNFHSSVPCQRLSPSPLKIG